MSETTHNELRNRMIAELENPPVISRVADWADILLPIVDAYVTAERADAWDEGCDAGEQNEHEFRPSRVLQNPYREGGAS